MRITDALADELTELVPRYALGREVRWEVNVTVMPGPPGPNGQQQLIPVVQFFFFVKSPILGAGDIGHVEMIPLEVVSVPHQVENIVQKTLKLVFDTVAEQTRFPGKLN